MNDDITVVITSFNYGAYLPAAVESALVQEGGAPRVIVVDDGSSDPEALRALEDLPPEVTLIRQANAGLSAARNTGLRASSTAYLIVLDADDRLAPDALAVMRGPLDRDPRLGFTYGIARFFGAWEGTLVFPSYDPYKLLYRHIIGSTALMRRALFDDVGGYDPAFTAYEDWEFWLHALAGGWHGEFVEKVTLNYRRHGDTMYTAARAHYHSWYRRLRHKHPGLYDRGGGSGWRGSRTSVPWVVRFTAGGGAPAQCRPAWRERCTRCSGAPDRAPRREPHALTL